MTKIYACYDNEAIHLEGSPSGLWRRLGKAVYPHGYRGFESLSLRHIESEYFFGFNKNERSTKGFLAALKSGQDFLKA